MQTQLQRRRKDPAETRCKIALLILFLLGAALIAGGLWGSREYQNSGFDQENAYHYIHELSGKVDRSEERQDERDAKMARTHILRFGDEVRIGARHSKESFDEVLADITAYEAYCQRHPEFPNNRTRAAEAFITETYDRCLRDNSFL